MQQYVFVRWFALLLLLCGSISAFAQTNGIREVRVEKKTGTSYLVRFRLEAGRALGASPVLLVIERRRNGNVEQVFEQEVLATRGTDGWYRYNWTTDAQTVKPGDDLRATIRFTQERPVAKAPQPSGNQRPRANAGQFREVQLPISQPLVLDAGASLDPEGGRLNYSWKQIGGPSRVQVLQPDSARARISGEVREGTYAFELIVRDNRGASDTDRLVVTVRPATAMSPPAVVTPPPSIPAPPVAQTPPPRRPDTVARTNPAPITRPAQPTVSAEPAPRLKGGPANALVNLLVPGLGHYYVSGDYTGEGRKKSAFIVTGLYAASAGTALYMKKRSDNQYKKYLAVVNTLEYQRDANGTVIGVRGPGAEANSYLESAQSSHRYFLMAAGTGLAISAADFVYTLLRGARNRTQWKQATRTSFLLLPQSNGWSAGIRLHF